jgi:trimethylamine--corrinoid protein Co-methyltransferase
MRVFSFYKLPVWGTGGCSDSNAMDVQAGAETAMSLLCSVLAGANLVHDVGFLSQGLCITPGFHLLNDEIIESHKPDSVSPAAIQDLAKV